MQVPMRGIRPSTRVNTAWLPNAIEVTTTTPSVAEGPAPEKKNSFFLLALHVLTTLDSDLRLPLVKSDSATAEMSRGRFAVRWS